MDDKAKKMASSAAAMLAIVMLALFAEAGLANADEQQTYAHVGTTDISLQAISALDAAPRVPGSSSSDACAGDLEAGQREGASNSTDSLMAAGNLDDVREEAALSRPLKTGDSIIIFMLGASACSFFGAAALIAMLRHRYRVVGNTHKRMEGGPLQ